MPSKLSDRASLTISVIWASCVLGCLLAFVPAVWDDSDDVRMSMIAAGIGSPDGTSEILVYMNVAIGSGLKLLYTQMPGVPWYTWMHIAIQLASFTALGFVTIGVGARKAALIVVAALHIAVASYFWTHLQFTTTSAILALAGVSLLILGLSRLPAENRFPILLSGCIFLAISSLVRLQSLQLVVVLSAVCLATSIWRFREIIAPLSDGLLAAATVGVICGGIAWNHSVYNSNSEMARYRSDLDSYAPVVNSVRVKLFHNTSDLAGLISERERNRVTAELRDLELRWNDMECLAWWYIFDDDVFSADSLARMNEVFSERTPLRFYFLMMIGTLPQILLNSNLFLVPAGVAIGIVIRERPGRLQFNACCLTWVLAFAVMVALLGTLKLPPRVFIPTGLTCCVMTFLLSYVRRSDEESLTQIATKQSPADERSPGRIWLSVMGLCAIFVSYQHVASAQTVLIGRAATNASIEKLLNRDDSLHVLLVPFPFSTLDPLQTQQHLQKWRFIYLDGHQRSPRQKRIIEAHLGQPLPEAVLQNPGVRFVVSPEARSLPFIQEFYRSHYGLDVSFPVEERLPWGTVRRVVSKPIGKSEPPVQAEAVEVSGSGS